MWQVIHGVETPCGEKCAYFSLKQSVVAQHGGYAGKRWLDRHAVFRQPIAHAADCFGWIVGMHFDVLAAEKLA